jgi:hypothetical protein
MPKSERILDLFPSYYRAADRNKLLAGLVRFLALPLEETDTHLFRIQRAHRIKVAEDATDIMRLAGALNLNVTHFEDVLDDESLGYGIRLDLMRNRVQRIAAVHLEGLGTPMAVLEGTAIFLNGEIVPERDGDPPVKQLDEKGYLHKAVLVFPHLTDAHRERIHLIENPLHRNKIEPAERWPMDSWVIENRSTEVSSTRLLIRGVGDRAVLPSLFCPDTEEGIAFNGIVPDGKTLILDDSGGATLDGRAVDDWITYFRGGIGGFSKWNASFFAEERKAIAVPFGIGGDEVREGPTPQKSPVPKAPIGRSEWYFQVAEGIFDRSEFDLAVYATEHLPVGEYDNNPGFDECVFDYPPSGVAGMAWDERLSCCFKLLLPHHLPGGEKAEVGKPTTESGNGSRPGNYLSRIGNILPRFKASGVEAFVDKERDAWILGESSIRSGAASEGEGLEFHSTSLYDQKSDMYVPLDSQTQASET